MSKMQKFVWMSVGLWAAIVPALLLAYASGPDVRYTGGPGDAPLGCSSSGCHTSSASGGPVNAGGGSVTATFSGGTTYTPGVTQTVTVTVSDPKNTLYGFQMSARLGSTTSQLSTEQAGTFTPGTGTQVLCDNNQIRQKNACPANSPVEFIEHTSPSQKAFTFQWTPPAAGSGPVHFYFAGNAVNGNGIADGGDHVYLNSAVLNPVSSCSAGAPSIAAVVQASAFGQSKQFAAGSWLEIYGTNLTTSNRSWAGSDFVGSQAPSKLDDVSVSINGMPSAAMSFISSGQVNVQAPADPATGPVNITLTNCNSTSAPFQITKDTLDPGVLGITVNGKQYLGALTPAGVLTGNPNAPAKSGDSIVVYGIGFGPTTPNIAPGIVVSGLTSLANFSSSFGSTPVTPAYAGFAPAFVGLYQFNMTVPTLANGDYPMTFQIGSVQVPQTLLFTVKN